MNTLKHMRFEKNKPLTRLSATDMIGVAGAVMSTWGYGEKTLVLACVKKMFLNALLCMYVALQCNVSVVILRFRHSCCQIFYVFVYLFLTGKNMGMFALAALHCTHSG